MEDNNNPDYEAIERLLKSRKLIVINQKLIIKVLGFTDMRDFFSSIGNWGYKSDFTYKDHITTSCQYFIRAYLKSFGD